MQESSTPSLCDFSPVIPYQRELLEKIRREFDYSLGAHEVLLSGSVGSAKSTVAAHLAVTHCLFNVKARVLLGRRALPDVKRTIFSKVLEHIGTDLREGKDYWINTVRGSIVFSNGSEIISGSWADKRYSKFRSLDLSAVIFEEIVENQGDDIQAYNEIKMRVGRLPHIKENWILCCTNPEGPSSHWYKYFIKPDIERKTRHVLYSVTTDNPFLPAQYIEQLKSDLDPKLARRMIYGEWVDIDEERPYYNYHSDKNFISKPYVIDPSLPIDIMHDFNIGGANKPMSAAVGQYVGDTFHVFKSFIVEGARTLDIMEEIQASGIFDTHFRFRVFGDASGRSRDTRSIRSDYDIIQNFLANYTPSQGGKLSFEFLVPLANPPIRDRHNTANSRFCSMDGKIRFYCYDKNVDEGFRLTRFKKGGNYLEDDSFKFQHVTTAVTYWIHYLTKRVKVRKEPYTR